MCSKYEAATGWHYHKLLTNLDVRAAGDLTPGPITTDSLEIIGKPNNTAATWSGIMDNRDRAG